MIRKPLHCALCNTWLLNPSGKWADGIRRLSVVLLSGHRMGTTLCGKCQLSPERMKELHQTMVQTSAHEIQERERIAGVDQAEAERRMVWLLTQDPPIGVLWDPQWRESP
jgi:hypothetical protein